MSNSDLTLLELSELIKNKKKVTSEELTVHVFKKYPTIFGMKEFPKYPNTNLVFRTISTLNSEGYIKLIRQNISITNKGKEYAEELSTDTFEIDTKDDLLKASEKKEIERQMGLKGFELFKSDNIKSPLDVDVYDFYGITVRTAVKDITRKKKNIDEIFEKIKNIKNNYFEELILYKNQIDKVLEGIINEYNTATN